VKLAELSNNSFEQKNVTFWGRSKHSDHSYIFSVGQDLPTPYDLRPWLCESKMTEQVLSSGRPTFKSHSDAETLLEAAVWTSLPLHLVHLTLFVVDAHVHLLVLHRPLEKPCASTREKLQRCGATENAGLEN